MLDIGSGSMINYRIFCVSDHTGVTVEAVARSVLAQFPRIEFSVKDRTAKANGVLAGEGHGRTKQSCQVLAGEMKPNLVSALIQRGALR